MLSSVILLFVLGGLFVFANKRPIYGLMYYFGIRMMIPYTARVFSLSFNSISLICLLLLLLPSFGKFYSSTDIIDKKYIRLVKNLFLMIFLLTIFSFVVPKFFQWACLFQTFFTEFLPSVILAAYLRKKEDYQLFCKLIAYFAALFSIYAIYTYIYSSNPIFELFNNSGRVNLDLTDYTSERMGLSNVAVGVYDDKIACSLICMLCCMFIYGAKCIKLKLRIISFCLCILALFLTTQRTGLLCFLLFVVINNLFNSKKTKNRLFFVLLGLTICCGLFIKNQIVYDLFSMIFSVFTDNSSNPNAVGGSSMEMRLMQLTSCLNYLDITSLLQGAGYGFAGYYYNYIWNIEIYGNDPRFLGFESYLFHIVMNSGIIGLACWGTFLKKLLILTRGYKSEYYLSFGLCYVTAILMTDASASLYLFFFLLVMNYKYFIVVDRIKN